MCRPRDLCATLKKSPRLCLESRGLLLWTPIRTSKRRGLVSWPPLFCADIEEGWGEIIPNERRPVDVAETLFQLAGEAPGARKEEA